MDYILSILIPTRNRLEYLQSCVEQVLGACSLRVQVVVQDNSDNEWEVARVLEKEHPNFNYYYHKSAVSFVENFSMALTHARGEYFCFIGDDDGVMPAIEQLADRMHIVHADAVSQNIAATYFWPNSQKAIADTETGLLKIFYANNEVRKYATNPELKKLLYTAGQNYLNRGLVKPYHGVVRTKLVERVKDVVGVYIDGLSPDIFISVALSCFVESVYVINYPITISGISPKSGSAASANGSHTGKLNDAPHFTGHKEYTWDKLVPQIYSVETIWADSALHAYRSCSQFNVDSLFCKEYMLQICKSKYSQFSEEINSYKNQYSYNVVNRVKTFISVEICEYLKRMMRRITRRSSDFKKYIGVSNIHEAEIMLSEYLTKNQISFDDTLKYIK